MSVMPIDDEALFDSDLREAVRFTEQEIAAHAFGSDDPEDIEDNRTMLEDMSRLEGIDGRPMSNEEGLASMLADGVSRPIESGEIEARDRRIAQLEHENQQWQDAYN